MIPYPPDIEVTLSPCRRSTAIANINNIMSIGHCKALVARGPVSDGKWKLESVAHRAPRDDELVINIVATGVCLADLHLGDVAEGSGGHPRIYYPRVLGHEGR